MESKIQGPTRECAKQIILDSDDEEEMVSIDDEDDGFSIFQELTSQEFDNQKLSNIKKIKT